MHSPGNWLGNNYQDLKYWRKLKICDSQKYLRSQKISQIFLRFANIFANLRFIGDSANSSLMCPTNNLLKIRIIKGYYWNITGNKIVHTTIDYY